MTFIIQEYNNFMSQRYFHCIAVPYLNSPTYIIYGME